jgi:anti-sigma regulatory factor (Ser/Thr protein kinase)
MDDPETRVTVMNMMAVNATAVCSTTAVADARDEARAFLQGLRGSRPWPPEVADTVVLVVSELVTNALGHGRGTCTLQLTAHPGTIEVAVHDPSRHTPRIRTPDLNGGAGGSAGPRSTVSPAPPRSPAGPPAARP